MKKIFIVSAVMLGSYACGGGTSESSGPISSSTSNSQIGSGSDSDSKTTAGDVSKGKSLIEGSDCRTCHQDNSKVIGPSYADVAAKYENTEDNVKMLAGKIIAGGKGNWGEIPMTPHPNVTEADAEAMVQYILSLKK